jgi:hypothetical protein
MGFNKFSKADGIRILIVLVLIAVVYCSFGSSLWASLKEFAFRAPPSPPTVTPTLLPTSTRTPSPTSTPAPTGTFTPTPIPTSAFLSGEVVSFWNEFDRTDPLRGDWVFSSNVRVENGVLRIEPSKDWSGVYGNSHLKDGQAVLVKFRFDVWSDIHMAVETGEFETDSYRSWGVGGENDIFSPVFSEGTIEYGNSFTPEDLELEPNLWYVLMLQIGGDRPFVARLWEYNDPTTVLNLQLEMNETWTGKEWLPLFLVGPQGKLEIDRYEELKAYSP